jgi:tetratricopeptide (TPR) repeat protein
MQVKLTRGEQTRVFEKGTKNLKAFLKLLKAREHIFLGNKEDNVLGKKLAEEAIALDPEFALAHSLLAVTYMYDVFFGVSKSPKVSFVQAMKLAKKAIALDESFARPHSLLAFIYVFTRQYEKVDAECERALELGPNDELVHMTVGSALSFTGRSAEAIPVLEKAIRLSPFTRSTTYNVLCLAYCFTGQFEKGIEACQRAVHGTPNDFFAHLYLTVAYSMGGREEEARASAEKVMRIEPKFSVEYFKRRGAGYKNKADVERLADALRKAGLK